jgi:hypothetical protein
VKQPKKGAPAHEYSVQDRQVGRQGCLPVSGLRNFNTCADLVGKRGTGCFDRHS